jgi:hypothetical protein
MRLTIHPDGAVEVERDQREGTPVVLADEAADIFRALGYHGRVYPAYGLDMTAHGRKLKVGPVSHRWYTKLAVSRTSIAAAHRRCLDAYGPDDEATREFAAMLAALPADHDRYTLALTASSEKR